MGYTEFTLINLELGIHVQKGRTHEKVKEVCMSHKNLKIKLTIIYHTYQMKNKDKKI